MGQVHVLFMNSDGTVQSSVRIGNSINGGPVLTDDDIFGYSVASLGDLDGDTVPDVAVGAWVDDTGGANRGATYVLLLNSTGTVKNSVKIASGMNGSPLLANGDTFGVAVASLGDLDNDGVTDLAVGANQDDTGGANRGAVHVLLLNPSGTVKSSGKIASGMNGGPLLADGDNFGVSVTSLGDVDGDGVTDLAVGANQDDTGGVDRGAVYVLFVDANGAVKSNVKIASGMNGGPPLADGDNFGASVTSLGDLNGDGLPDLAVGAELDDTGGADRGAVYSMFLNSTVVTGSEDAPGSDNGGFTPSPLMPATPLDQGDTLAGGNGDDTIIGSTGDDTINGMGGDDSIVAGGGNDTVLGGAGRDTIDGGAGDDSLDGQGGADSITGGDGDDEIVFEGDEDGNDTIFGGNGADMVTVNTGVTDDTVVIAQDAVGRVTVTEGSSTLVIDSSISIVNVNGQAGTDMITVGDLSDVRLSALTVDGGAGPDTIDATGLISGIVRVQLRGGVGNDTITGGTSGDSLFGDAGDDSIDGGAGNDSIQGGDGNDVINTQDGDDTADGGAGNDSVTGGLGNDSLGGGLDDDTLVGNEGDDTLRGGFGDDNLNGNSGNDSLDGSFGRDSISGGSGDDVADGGRDADLINGQSGNDTLRGDHGDDTLNGQAGDDEIVGGDGNDRVSGGSGRDGIAGNDGDDTLNGNGGSDTLRGNDGNDSLTGGSSNDTLIGDQGDDILDGDSETDLGVTGEGADATLDLETIDESFLLSSFQLTKLDGI
jgi:Ca2+-binding RTX toxin-like protein